MSCFFYAYAILDPRNIPAATAANDKIFENPVGVLGIEVTVPALAKRCLRGNIDPQHLGADPNKAAIEVALDAVLPPDGTTLATIRADLDSVGSMVVLSLRYEGVDMTTSERTARIQMVAESDRFARGGYPGPRPLLSKESPWQDETASAESSRPLATIAVAVADFKIPVEKRVGWMMEWLLAGKEPAGYRDRVEKERTEMIEALERGDIKVRVDGGVVVVESAHRAATSIGYSQAPVVVALNPAFRFQGGEPHRKFTVCQFESGYVDLKKVAADLSEREVGWGGSPTIVGSPQGQGSNLSIEEVVAVVRRYLLK